MSLSSKTELARALFRTPPPDSVTRISGTATADSSDGTVTVQLEDGDVIEVGTIGSVSAGDTVTIHVQRGEAQVIASEGWGDALQATADEAAAVANATNQHFWSDTNGAHVTEVTQDEWNDSTSANYHSGYNSLWNSLGLLFRKALNNLVSIAQSAVAFYDGQGNAAGNVTASFGASGAQVGKLGESHIEMDYHSMKMVDKNGSAYLHVSDLRDSSGKAEISESWIGTGYTTQYYLSYTAADTSYTVKVNGTVASPTKTTTGFTFSSAPAADTQIVAEYETTSAVVAFTFGRRYSGTPIGAYSFSEGYSNKASGRYSHAEGYLADARGDYSHAEGYKTEAFANYSHAHGYCTKAWYRYQTVIGKYNDTYPFDAAFIIGNGTSSDEPSNALTVDWDGNVEAAGGLTLGGKAVSAWVVETGTDSNGWAYEKRSDGTYRAKWSNDLTLNAGTAWGSGFYFHMQTAAIPVPSFSTSFEVVSAVKN
ncbi:MAG: hypothetical protein IKE55_07655, partial [Kiritimatiellae bacterium]|nr:hypothetical protein [Kiritimatiellia bacterium]